MPSKEHDRSSILSLRLPDTLLARLDRYLAWMERRRGESLSRNQVIRVALAQWLDTAEAQGGMIHPEVLRQHFQAGYNALRSGNDAVQIQRLRQRLGWPPDRFDALVEQLRAESKVILYTGAARHLSDDEQQQSYEVNGQLYLSLAWKDSKSPCNFTSDLPLSLTSWESYLGHEVPWRRPARHHNVNPRRVLP